MIRYGVGGSKGGKGGGGATYVPSEQPNTLQSKSLVKVVDLIGEGEVLGLVDGGKSIYFDDTPLQNADGTYNFTGISYEFKTGAAGQTYLSGFPSVESEVAVGAQVKFDTPVTRTVSNPNADALRVTVRLPALTFQDPKNGDLRGSEVKLAIDVRTSTGNFTQVLQDTITGKTTAPYDRAYRIQLPVNGSPWTVRVRRLTADSTQSNLQNDTYWASYTEIVDNKVSYMDTAVVGLSVDSSQFGSSVPTRSYDMQGLVVSVPTNYNPNDRVYTGVWDGTFKKAYSNNPAWILYDVLTNDRYGLGEYVSAMQVDKPSLYSIARYCDEMVPDGFGGMEPRFTINCIINSREEAFNVIQAIASAIRGMAYWATGAVMVVQDSPKDATRIVGASNVIDGSFTYEGTSLKARHTAALVSWNDPNDSYRQAIEVVEDPEGIAKYGWRQADVIAYGCTSRGQAHRFGKWILDTEKHETQSVSFRAGLDMADVLPGEIINIQDSAYAGVNNSGRTKSGATTTVIPLDRTVTLSPSVTYTITVQLPNNTIEERLITNTSGTATSITVSQPFAMAPTVEAMWAISGSDVALRPFRVMSNREVEKHQFEIVALEYDATKFARVEQGIDLAPNDFSNLDTTGVMKSPSGLDYVEYLYKSGPAVKAALTLSWSNPDDARVQFYEVQVQVPNGTFETVATTARTNYDVQDTISGLYSFRVRSIGFDRTSAWTSLNDQNILSLSGAPANVTNFKLNRIGQNAYLSWDKVEDLDLDHYTIKFSTNTDSLTSWATASLLVERVSSDATSVTAPARVGTYFIKAVDSGGTESDTATSIVTAILGLEQLNAVEVVQEDPAFSGVKDGNLEVVGGELRLSAPTFFGSFSDVGSVADIEDESGSDGDAYYYFANRCDLGEPYPCRVTPNISIYGISIYDIFNNYPNVNSVPNIAQTVDPSNYAVRVDIRTTNDDPDGVSPVWTDWSELIISDYTARAFEFRIFIQAFGDTIIPVVTALSVTVDMPDRVDGENDIPCPDTGMTVSFTPSFKARPAVAVTAESLDTGDYWVISNQTRTGFDIRFYNASGVGVARTFDWVAKGYGYEN